jgi:hypothetical protein
MKNIIRIILRFNLILPVLILLLCYSANAQDRLYRNEFPLKDVTLLNGPFRHARDLNINTLLKYDVDRLIAPFRKEAGLPEKAPLFPNWQGLDGHIGGHYLSAMAMNYAATGNAECKKRMDYMITELKACQDANGINNAEWGNGYLGGIPNSTGLWSTLKEGDFSVYRKTWAPWYNIHKMYAGLRDAWVYTGNDEAKAMFLKFCDWGIYITSGLSDAQMENMLDSEHGGYVYFTPARPRHYRVYSAPNEAMWCCVGTGMENHGKYNQFIYTHKHDSLFLNLFIPSELNWREKGIMIRQETEFPYEEQTKLTVTKGSSYFKLMVRYPSWVNKGALKITINGETVPCKTNPSSYIVLDRQWKKGDVVQVTLPMHSTTEQLPNVPEYIAFMHGPILLGAKTGTEDLKGLIADDSRWGQIPAGQKLPVDKAPIIVVDDKSKIVNKLIPVKGKPLSFTARGLTMLNPIKAELEPFFGIHNARYMMYWMTLTNEQSRSYLDSLAILEKERADIQRRTIDYVATGEQQPETDHEMRMGNSNTGNNQDEFWRDARNEGYFSYNLMTNSEIGLYLLVRYWGAERGNRKFDIYLDNEKLFSEDNTGKWNQNRFIEVEYPIPDSVVKGKSHIRIKFQALPNVPTSAVYSVRLIRKNTIY